MNPDIRAAVLARANGLCECCSTTLSLFGGQLDHFWGKARDESVESCWMLTVDCHYQKTNSIPSSAFWLRAWIRHLRKYGYDTTKAGNRLHFVETRAALGK